MNDIIQMSEWDPEAFHRRVLELEKKGYVWQGKTYRVTAEMDPETGKVIHLYTIEMCSCSQGGEMRTPDEEARSKRNGPAMGKRGEQTSVTEPRLLVKIHAGPRCISFPSEHALIGVTGLFVREVQLLAGTPVVVQFCRGLHEVSVPGTVYAQYAGLGLSVEFQEGSGLAVRRLARCWLRDEDDL